MSDDLVPPPSGYRLKPQSGATSRPAAVAPPTEPAAPIDVRDFVQPIAAHAFKFSPKPAAKAGLDDKEKTQMRMLCLGALLGVALCWVQVSHFRTAWAARSWPTVPGHVVTSRVITIEGDRRENE